MTLTIESLARSIIEAPPGPPSEWTIEEDAAADEYARLKAAGKLRSPPVAPPPRKSNGGRPPRRITVAVSGSVDPEQAIAAMLAAAQDTLTAIAQQQMIEDGCPPAAVRPQTAEAKAAARKAIARAAKTVGPDRPIRNPPDAKAAARRAEARARTEAAFEGTPAHAKAARKAKDAAGSTVGPRAPKRASKPAPKTEAPPNGKTKTAMVGEMLTRKGGCTTADILAATGWPSVSVPQQAKACGLTLRKEKTSGEPTRYFGIPK